MPEQIDVMTYIEEQSTANIVEKLNINQSKLERKYGEYFRSERGNILFFDEIKNREHVDHESDICQEWMHFNDNPTKKLKVGDTVYFRAYGFGCLQAGIGEVSHIEDVNGTVYHKVLTEDLQATSEKMFLERDQLLMIKE